MTSLFIHIGKNIELKLKESQLSKTDFMTSLNISNQTFEMLLSGKKALNKSDIENIARALSISPDELIDVTAFEPNENSTLSKLLSKTKNEDTKEQLLFIDYLMDLTLQTSK
ncbi:helix-turn-helix domain-containing protein [Kurthia sibirica]|uniref:HTH cro/C1-type domain-containing protein n=1 Tax=Kurthia sibirica TaxID=202750 RepID=A0A2U3AIU5_9BACL|nr:helix-turn-helix transcriptional regulator [Kurthia sibirica]PWI24458.1 hypothetical protein DEX24_13415 [Kurthia sibirica]GEK35698.1 hypothetical protein KSI01_32310 [Kurthia sibirica]